MRRLDRDPEGTRALLRSAVQHAAIEAADDHRLAAVGQAAGLLDARYGTDLCVAALDARDEQ